MIATRCAAALAAAALLTLGGCGGAIHHLLQEIGEEDNENENGDRPDASMPGPSSAEIKATLNALIDRSDTIIEEHDRHTYSGPDREAKPLRQPFDLDDIAYNIFSGQSLAADGEYQFVASEGGLSAAGAAWDRIDPGGRFGYAYLSFSFWMDYSLFLAMETIVTDPFHQEFYVYSDIVSVGAASGTNPAYGSATWTGVMVGIDENFRGHLSALETAEPNVYLGDAQLTLDNFTNPTVDVRFSNITNEVRVLRDVVWTDLPVTEGGFEGQGILGRFYGPQHEEVGGVFQFDAINGAFGGTRD